MWRARIGAARAGLALALGAITLHAGCFRGDVDLTGRACPCADGWQCVGGICVPPGALDAGGSGGMDAGASDAARAEDAGVNEDASAGQDADATDDAGPVPSTCPPDPPCTLYVSPAGSDMALGRLTAPFATLQHAMDVAMPGDVVCARTGTYQGVTIARSGEPGAPIVLRSFPGEIANVRGAGVGLFAGWGVEVGWVWILELDIEQDAGKPSASGECMYLHSAHDAVIRGNTLHDCFGGGIGGNGANVLIDSNRIRNVGAFSISDPVSHTDFPGIWLSGTTIQVVNNVIHENAAAGIAIDGTPFDVSDPNHPASALYAGADDWLVSNNVLALNQNQSGIRVSYGSAMNALIQNNAFYENGQHGPYANGDNGIEFWNAGLGTVVRNNLYYGTGATVVDSGGSHVESGALIGDPLFLDVPGGDFHVGAGSPAIGMGISDRAPAFDRDCVPRGSPPDVGAYER